MTPGKPATARDRILGRIRATLLERERSAHPGDFEGWRPDAPDDAPAAGASASSLPAAGFRALFEAAGGAVVHVADTRAAAAWLREFQGAFASGACGEGVPEPLRPTLPIAGPNTAEMGVSMARAAVAETGSLVMDARDGRRAQLLVPTHIVFVAESAIFATLRDALRDLRGDLPSAIGLHSGPSKSADIGQIMVKGVHGPGRVVAVVIADGLAPSGPVR